MCGIAGIITAPSGAPVQLEELRRMIGMMTHRGPDGYGIYRDERTGLAHARLSLIDRKSGAQPIHNTDGTVWITFNGEIFNYVELRKHLMTLGHRFYTNGDTEVIVQCYERYGDKTWSMLNGQFAFALWDRRQPALWLVRDRFGIVPLHYARAASAIVFASEAKALFASGRVDRAFDPPGLAETFTAWSTLAPRTLFKGVSLVQPATALRFDADLTCTASVYWEPALPERGVLNALSVDEVDSEIEARLERAVTLRLRADVPVGCYVSGGLDSSLISSIAQDQRDGPLDSFGIRFEDPRFDETAEQRLMSRTLGSRHHEILCTASSIRDSIEDVVWHCETPLLRTSPVPMFLLAKTVKEAGIRTVLTGEGADELLAGYSIFKEDHIRRFWARQPNSRLRPALFSRIHHYVGPADSRSSGVWQSFFGHALGETAHPFYSHLIRWHNTAWTVRLLAPAIRDASDLESMMARWEAQMPSNLRDFDDLTRAQLIEIRSFLSSYLLSCQGDRVAMAHGVEARYPFLDPDFADFALTLPKRHKLRGRQDKIALRRVAARRLPAGIWQRRKQPYRAPIGAALFSAAGRERFADTMEPAQLARDGLCDARAVSQLLRRAGRLDGEMPGEREEMGLAGILTLSLLTRHFGAGFARHVEHGRTALSRLPADVFVDRTTQNAHEAPPKPIGE